MPESIFDGVLWREDAYTNLLRNALSLDDAFCHDLLELILPSDWPNDLSWSISTQNFLGEDGRADLILESLEYMVLIEVKVAFTCERTENQQFDWDEPHGYASYLRKQTQVKKKVALIVIAPLYWKDRNRVEKRLQKLSRPELPAKLLNWENIAALPVGDKFSQVVKQFLSFLGKEFSPIMFSKAEDAILGQPATADRAIGVELISSIGLKLHDLVKRTADDYKIQASEDKKLISIDGPYHMSDEYGFTILVEGKKQIWFGQWGRVGWPLVIGYDRTWNSLHEDVKARLSTLEIAQFISNTRGVEKWAIYKLPSTCFTGQDPLKHLLEALNSILKGSL